MKVVSMKDETLGKMNVINIVMYDRTNYVTTFFTFQMVFQSNRCLFTTNIIFFRQRKESLDRSSIHGYMGTQELSIHGKVIQLRTTLQN